MRDLDTFKGCLIGGAAGDALGYTVEFMSASSIFHRYGPRGITGYELRHGVGEISDDTQMTLFTAAGLLTAGSVTGDYASCIAASYRDWYRTQTERYPLTDGARSSWLADVPGLFHRRAPGNTCMSALAQGGNGTMERPLNHSKGCGGVMRAAPAGLYFCGRGCTPDQAAMTGALAAALTHGHELGYLPAAMLAHIVWRIAGQGDSIADAVRDAMDAMPALFPKARHLDGLLALTQRAAGLSAGSTDDLDAIRSLGEGWVGDEALAIAVYCALRYAGDFEKGVVAAVNHDGDSDSTGAIAGNILGASLGYGAIPRRFTDALELKDVILEVAEDLYSVCQPGGPGPRDGAWARKYGR